MTRFTDNNSRFGHAIRKTADITDGRDGIPQIRRVLYLMKEHFTFSFSIGEFYGFV